MKSASVSETSDHHCAIANSRDRVECRCCGTYFLPGEHEAQTTKVRHSRTWSTRRRTAVKFANVPINTSFAFRHAATVLCASFDAYNRCFPRKPSVYSPARTPRAVDDIFSTVGCDTASPADTNAPSASDPWRHHQNPRWAYLKHFGFVECYVESMALARLGFGTDEAA